MDPELVTAITSGGGLLVLAGREIVRLTKELKAEKAERLIEVVELKKERDTAEALADKYHDQLLGEQVKLAQSESRFASLQGQIKALTEQQGRLVEEQSRLVTENKQLRVEIGELRIQVSSMESGHD